ncbi:MAG TPA: hypothetical protein VFT19_04630 [Solirubrobacterales bacterium]|nr:hypothetical protein [Solirubrobacterales bacterium]
MLPAADLIDIQAGFVLTLITLIALPIALIAFARSGPLWEGVGKGPFAIEQELPPPSRLAQPQPPVDRRLQETEARQMLEAKSYRRRQRGEAPLDVEAELARLLDAPGAGGPAIDEKLRAEVRQLVVARNERRMRRGEDPLDVEAELERQLADL